MTVSLCRLIPQPRRKEPQIHPEYHQWLFADVPEALLAAFADDLIGDIAANLAEPFLAGDLLAVRDEHHRRRQ